MPKYGATSERHLAGVAAALVRVMRAVVARFDNSIWDGARTVAEQAENVRRGVSQTMDSKHVVGPGLRDLADAVDAYPFPVRLPQAPPALLALSSTDRAAIAAYTKDLARFYYFGGYVLGTADQLGVPLRWGGDWNGNREVNDQKFDDLPHFELLT